VNKDDHQRRKETRKKTKLMETKSEAGRITTACIIRADLCYKYLESSEARMGCVPKANLYSLPSLRDW